MGYIRPDTIRSNLLNKSNGHSLIQAGQIKMKPSFVSLAPFVVSLGKCLSLPPLIPSIPGVTEGLSKNAPPLPILQIPTPPLESPQFNGSDIKPKKVGYFWTGAGDKQHKGLTFLPTACLSYYIHSNIID